MCCPAWPACGPVPLCKDPSVSDVELLSASVVGGGGSLHTQRWRYLLDVWLAGQMLWGSNNKEVEQLGRQMLLNIPILSKSQQLSSLSTAFPLLFPVLFLPFSKRVCEKAEWIFLFKAFWESLMLNIHLCHCVFSKIKYKHSAVFLTKPTPNLKSANDIIIPFNYHCLSCCPY